MANAIKKNEWFEETFLLSFEAKMNNPKYPNQCLLTDGQYRICEKYMEEHEGHDSDYRRTWHYFTYTAGKRTYTAEQRGRYFFLHRYIVPYKGHIHKRITWHRLDRKEDIEYFGLNIRRKEITA